MNEITNIYESVVPVIALIEENKIESKINDLEDNLKVTDGNWEVIEEIRSSLWNLKYAYEELEDKINERQ